MLAGPALIGLGGSLVDVPARVRAWVDEPTRVDAARLEVAGASTRPVRGYVAGAPPSPPESQPLPSLQPVKVPEGRVDGAPAQPFVPPAPAPALGTRAVIQTGGAGVTVRRAIGLDNSADPFLREGTPVQVSPSGAIRVQGQSWRSVRAAGGIIGWVPEEALAFPDTAPTAGSAGPSEAGAATRQVQLRVANTDGAGVVLRASPKLGDRTATGVREGGTVAVLQTLGADWVQVRTDTGEEGWVPARFLAPAP